MSYYVDGIAYDFLLLPCGSKAYFDEDSGISYRCELCGAVVGSIGQPQGCKDEMDKWDNWARLGGKGWNYQKGTPDDAAQV